MQEIDIKEIVVKDNIRTDYGDLTEMVASIKQYGIRKPLELKADNELVDGHRRLKACECAINQLLSEGKKEKADLLRKLPFFYNDGKVGKTTSQLISGIFGKNLNLVEQGESFKKYMEENKQTIEQMAEKINKRPEYLQHRIDITELTEEAKIALVEKRISLGHALLFKNLNSGEQKKAINNIKESKLSVADFADAHNMRSKTMELKDVVFDKKDCKDCRFNGGEQALLTEIGDHLTGLCLDSTCFMKKNNAWIQSETDKLKKEGINVLPIKKIGQMKNAEQIYSHDDRYQKIAKKLRKESENFAVVFDTNRMPPKKEIYCINPKALEEEKPEPTKTSEKELNMTRKERLRNRVEDHKRDWLINKTKEMIGKESKPSKALILFTLIEAAYYQNVFARSRMQKILKEINIKIPEWGRPATKMKKLLELNPGKIDELIHRIATETLNQIYTGENLEPIANATGVDLKKQFQITKELLDLYTKGQVIELITEFKIGQDTDWKKLNKKPDYIDFVLKNTKPGMVPEIVQKVKI